MNKVFNDLWKFLKTDIKTTYSEVCGLLSRFEKVSIPHDWLIWNSKDLYETSSGWYFKEFDVKSPATHTFIRFDGVYMDSEVYVNDVKVGEWKYGYSTFTFEITDQIITGINKIIVHVRHEAPNSRWYSGAGIFRNVYLIEKGENYLPVDGSYVHITPVEDGNYNMRIETEVFIPGITQERPHNIKYISPEYELVSRNGEVQRLGSAEYQGLAAETYISRYRSAKEKLAYEPLAGFSEPDFASDYVNTGIFSLAVTVNKPDIWDVTSPNLYTLKVRLYSEGTDEYAPEILDEDEFRIGFKDVRYDHEEGFFLNGRSLKINGVCEHHDLGAFGSAFNSEAMERKLIKLKKMGVNALRTSHNMPDPEVMRLCDEMGILVDDEAFDMWEMTITKYDYARFFPEWSYKDIASWIRRDRNHVSGIMWSIGNEIPDTVNGEHGVPITKHIVSNLLVYDPYINLHATIGSNFMEWEKARKCTDVIGFAGYNYGERLYREQHEEYPDWYIYGSETSSMVTSRGVYHFPLEEMIMSDEDGQCSSIGNSSSSWGARNVESCIYIDRDMKFSLGQFLWSGFDYIGEPTPYTSKNSYFGQFDTAGFPKDQYYCFMAEWTDEETNPFVHLYPYWNWNEGQIIDVRACSTGKAVELFLNGRSLGLKKINHQQGKDLVPTWQVPFEKGEILAVAYDETGKEIARDRQVTFGDSVKPVIFVEHHAKYVLLKSDAEDEAALTIEPDGRNVYFIDISMADKDGNIVENAMDYVKVSVENGQLLGLDNGDSTDYDSYKTDERKLFNGKLLAIISPDGNAPVKVIVKLTKYTVPVRQIELLSEKPLYFTPECKEIIVKAKVYPENATDKTVSFKSITRSGIETCTLDFTVIDFDPENGITTAVVKARGDGNGYIRATSLSGTDTVRIISQLEFSSDGLGEFSTNPYKFVSAGLNSSVSGNVRSGNDKGVSTAYERCAVVFDNIDFGQFGSDEITLWLFTFNSDVYEVNLYEGNASYEGQGRFICTLNYSQPCDWNVYKPQTFKLPERIKGINSITFVVNTRLHIKGFVFTKPEKAFSEIYASECKSVSGDSYEVKGNSVINIGNNVTLLYDDMDFGENGAEYIEIKGKTPLNEMTVRLQFTNENGEVSVQSFSVKGGQSVHECRIERLFGKGKIEFIFLPGTQFDFDSFRFTE